MRKVKNLTVPAKAEKPAPVQATKPTLGGSVSIRRTGSDGLAKKQAKTSSPPVVDYSDLVELNLIATDEGALPWRARAFLRGLRCKPSDWYGSDWPYGWRYRTEDREGVVKLLQDLPPPDEEDPGDGDDSADGAQTHGEAL